MEMKFINYAYKESNLNFSITPGKIIGLTGNSAKELSKHIALKQLNKGTVTIDDTKITKDNINYYRKKIAYISKDTYPDYFVTVHTLMIDHIKRNSLTIKDPNKKITDALKIVGLDDVLLSKNPLMLSKSGKRLLEIAIGLLSNPDLIIIDDPFKYFDKYNEKKIVMLLERLRDQFNKTIIIVSNDSNTLYKYTDEMLFIKNDDIFLSGPTKELYLRVDYLKKNKFEVPPIVEFTYTAKKKKKAKIDYHKDVRDIIKDIYKHV